MVYSYRLPISYKLRVREIRIPQYKSFKFRMFVCVWHQHDRFISSHMLIRFNLGHYFRGLHLCRQTIFRAFIFMLWKAT
jgi:hypothetical protein